MPLGLPHRDHVYTAAASAQAFRLSGRRELFLYEELPYRAGPESARSIKWAHRLLRSHGYVLSSEKVSVSDDFELKEAAVRCYQSQLPALGAAVEMSVQSPGVIVRLLRVKDVMVPLTPFRLYRAFKLRDAATRPA
jgi:LmbE family N-acetylglucosaminyl deacetylase